MVWSSVSPDGTKSVATNTPIMAANTSYTETTMNVDHFWNIGTNQDGHHKFAQMPQFVSGGNPADPNLATGMDGVVYYKVVSSTNPRIELFSKNANGVYQVGPSYMAGSIALSGSYVSIATVPNTTYGQIFILDPTGSGYDSWGFFTATGGQVYSYVNTTVFQSSSTATFNHKFDNGGGNGLVIRVRCNNSPSQVYNTKVLYWGQ